MTKKLVFFAFSGALAHFGAKQDRSIRDTTLFLNAHLLMDQRATKIGFANGSAASTWPDALRPETQRVTRNRGHVLLPKFGWARKIAKKAGFSAVRRISFQVCLCEGPSKLRWLHAAIQIELLSFVANLCKNKELADTFTPDT